MVWRCWSLCASVVSIRSRIGSPTASGESPFGGRGASTELTSLRSRSYGHEIRQFHEVRLAGSVGPTEDPHADSYTLGKAPEPVSAQPPKYGSGSGLLAKKDQRIPATLGGGGAGGVMGVGMDDGGRYLSQVWEDGTVCDKTGLPRTVEVQVGGLSLLLEAFGGRLTLCIPCSSTATPRRSTASPSFARRPVRPLTRRLPPLTLPTDLLSFTAQSAAMS